MTLSNADALGGRRVFQNLIERVVAAGELALAMQRELREHPPERKSDRSPVTRADQAVEDLLRNFVVKEMPQMAFFGEETGAAGDASSRFRVVLDPIDGTRAFIRDLPTWSVLLGIEMDGEPIAGIAFQPATSDLYVGIVGEGATWNGRPCRLSNTDSLADAYVALGAPLQFAEAKLDALYFAAVRAADTTRSFGDFAGFADLLRGRADVVIEPHVQPYDVAAPAAIIRAAGGAFTRFDGTSGFAPGHFVASNALLHDEALALIRSVR